ATPDLPGCRLCGGPAARRSALGARSFGLGRGRRGAGGRERFLPLVGHALERHHFVEQLEVERADLPAVVGRLVDVARDLLQLIALSGAQRRREAIGEHGHLGAYDASNLVDRVEVGAQLREARQARRNALHVLAQVGEALLEIAELLLERRQGLLDHLGVRRRLAPLVGRAPVASRQGAPTRDQAQHERSDETETRSIEWTHGYRMAGGERELQVFTAKRQNEAAGKAA